VHVMTTPEERSALIAGYLDGELDAARSIDVARVIDEDDAWRAEYDAQRAVRTRLMQMPRPALPEEARARFRAALADRAHRDVDGARGQVAEVIKLVPTTEAPEPMTTQDAPGTRWHLIALAAAILLVMGAGSFLADLAAKRPIPIARDAIAQYDEVAGDPGALGALEASDIAAQARAYGWTYHDLKDDDKELSLLGTWKSEVRQRPALAMAFEREGEVVVQLLVDKEAFNTPEVIQDAVRRTGVWSEVRAEHTIVGWNDGEHAVLVVGTGDPAELKKFRPEACYGNDYLRKKRAADRAKTAKEAAAP